MKRRNGIILFQSFSPLERQIVHATLLMQTQTMTKFLYEETKARFEHLSGPKDFFPPKYLTAAICSIFAWMYNFKKENKK